MRSILVTGASTGIGRACALHLANAGHRVFAGVRSEADAQGLRHDGPHLLVPVHLDVTRADHIDELVRMIANDADCLFGLVNNAGVARGGPVEFLPVGEWREQFEVNVVGQVAVTKAMLPLIRRYHGRIVFMGSISGKVATMMMAPYDASKFAVEAIGESLRAELRPFGVRVSVIEPGAVKTGIWHKGRKTADRLERDLPREAKDLYAAHMAAIRKGIELQDSRGIRPERVARAVEHALFAPRPKVRYLVGVDARVQSAMVRLLPDRTREAIVRRFAGL